MCEYIYESKLFFKKGFSCANILLKVYLLTKFYRTDKAA